MTKYIRTNDGAIYKIEDNNLIFDNNKIPVDINKIEKDYKVADTIEELFMPNDLLVVGDDKNQMPIFIESIEYLKAWLYCHDIYKIKEFYIKNGNDFKCVAKRNEKGELVLI